MWTDAALSPFLAGQIGDEGTIIGVGLQGPDANGGYLEALLRWQPGQPVTTILTAPFGINYGIGVTALSGDGQKALIETSPPGASNDRQLWLVDLPSGSKQLITEQILPSLAYSAVASLGVDGRRAVFYWVLQNGPPLPLYVWDQASGQTQALPPGNPALSGNGSILWAWTSNGLLRFDLDQGTNQELLAPFPTLSFAGGSSIPGSALRFSGGDPVAGEHFRLNGFEFPILQSQPGQGTVVQVPWEMAPVTQQASLVVSIDGYPFESGIAFPSLQPGVTVAPAFEPLYVNSVRVGFLKASSQDFTHLITTDTPALPGETISVWMTGLGPLDQPVPTGVPGPSNPPAHPLAHLVCYMSGLQNDPPLRGVALPFIGYAPGMVGVYQADLTIPADWPAGISSVSCLSGTGPQTQAQLPVGSR